MILKMRMFLNINWVSMESMFNNCSFNLTNEPNQNAYQDVL